MFHTKLNKNAKRQLAVCILLCCAPIAVYAVGPDEQDKLAAMQAVIDQQQREISQQQSENKQQRSEINQQKQALETQQQKLADQQKMLESLQSQLNTLAGEPKDVETTLSKWTLPQQGLFMTH